MENEKLNKNYNIEFITKKLRKIILSFLNNYNTSDCEVLLDLFFTSDILDNKIIKYNAFFNENNLKYYKNLLFKIILSDNYLYLKSTQKDIIIEYYDVNNEQLEDEIDEDNDFVHYMDEKILNILENNDLYEIDEEMRLNLYSNFIVYNVLLSEQKQDYENIKDDKNAIKTLKKLNPIYFLDF